MLLRGFSPEIKTRLASPIGAAIDSLKPNSLDILKLLLNERGPFNEDDHFCLPGELNEPMIHAAIRRSKLETVQMLVTYGIDPRWMDTDGVSALDLARQLRLSEIVTFLENSLARGKKAGGRRKPKGQRKSNK